MAALFEGFVQLIADAIDKEVAIHWGALQAGDRIDHAVAQATCDVDYGPFAEFNMDDADRYELNIAALLPGYEMSTTPEWVMDKATKLQTVFDQIEGHRRADGSFAS